MVFVNLQRHLRRIKYKVPRQIGKKVAKKAEPKTRLFAYIPSQGATAGPPLGTELGGMGINISDFVKDFNLKTSVFKPGIQIPCMITLNPDRSYNMVFRHPPVSYYLKQAAGISRGAMDYKTEVAGKITRKHVYEIAKIKSEDANWQMFDMRDICKFVVDSAYTMGIHVVDELDADEYAKFLEERQKLVDSQLEAIKAVKEAKLLRTL